MQRVKHTIQDWLARIYHPVPIPKIDRSTGDQWVGEDVLLEQQWRFDPASTMRQGCGFVLMSRVRGLVERIRMKQTQMKGG